MSVPDDAGSNIAAVQAAIQAMKIPEAVPAPSAAASSPTATPSASGTTPTTAPTTGMLGNLLKRQPSIISNDPQRFIHGVLLRGKFIGCEDVREETGDEVCQTSMIKLKAVVLAKKEHKRRICVRINLEGVELLDEKTNASLYKHSVNRISYIARDVNDARAIGYIYKMGANHFQYFAIKTERPAQELFNNLKDLFEVVLEMRKKNAEEAKTKSESSFDDSGAVTGPTFSDAAAPAEPVKSEPAQATSAGLLDIGFGDEPVAAPPAATAAASSSLFMTEAAPVTAAPASTPSSSNDLFGLLDAPAPTPSHSTNQSKLLSNELGSLSFDMSRPPSANDKFSAFGGLSSLQQPASTNPSGMGSMQNAFMQQQQPQQSNNPFGGSSSMFGSSPQQQQPGNPFPAGNVPNIFAPNPTMQPGPNYNSQPQYFQSNPANPFGQMQQQPQAGFGMQPQGQQLGGFGMQQMAPQMGAPMPGQFQPGRPAPFNPMFQPQQQQQQQQPRHPFD